MSSVPSNEMHKEIWDGTEPMSYAVVRAVAEATDRCPDELPTLAETINPDAIDDLFQPPIERAMPPDLDLSFTYAGVKVRLLGSGHIYVESVSDPDSSGR